MSRLLQLAINSEGFIFDPNSGGCFSVNPTGLLILKALQEQKPVAAIAREMVERFDEVPEVIEKDILDFMALLRIYQLL
ncbi:MAG: PqqD family protein [Deltaproteobacteria bacterium]|nr:PqqD family protein [Deltaproteobacteria bacterium]